MPTVFKGRSTNRWLNRQNSPCAALISNPRIVSSRDTETLSHCFWA